MDALLATDRAYSAASVNTDLVSGISAMFANDVAMAIPRGKLSASGEEGAKDAAFIVGAEAIGLVVSDGKPEEPSTLVWAPDRVIVASSGDLGGSVAIRGRVDFAAAKVYRRGPAVAESRGSGVAPRALP